MRHKPMQLLNSWRWPRLLTWLALAVAALTLPAIALAVPKQLVVTGSLLNGPANAVPDGAYDVKFSLYASEVGGAALWTESTETIGIKGGLFTTLLGEKVPLDGKQLPSDGLWLGVKVGDDPELPRRPLTSTPFALRAGIAEGLDCSGCVGAGQLAAGVLEPYAKSADLASVAKTGNYADLKGLPDLTVYPLASSLATVAATGQYGDLVGTPKLADVATTGAYADLIGAPALAKVATSGQYNDLLGQPTLAKVANSGAYADLTGQPTLAKVGSQCGSGLVVSGIAADGSLVCAPGYDASQFQFPVSANAPKTCTPATLGSAYVSPSGPTLYICNGASWYPFSLSAIGTQAFPGKSCKDILAAQPASKDGAYWVDPFGNGAAQVWCDMTTDGGGWTLPLWYGSDNKVVRYYDFVQKKNYDFKKVQQLNLAAIDAAKGLNLNNLGSSGVAFPYAAGNVVVVKMRREYGLTGAGFVFQTSATAGDDGVTLYDDGIGTRTHGSGYQVRGTKLSNLLPDQTSSHAFAMTIAGDGATFYTATNSYTPANVGPGASYDTCTIESLYLGCASPAFDPWKSGNLYIERIAVFNAGLPAATIAAYVQQMGVF